jgi:hypothetical protein
VNNLTYSGFLLVEITCKLESLISKVCHRSRLTDNKTVIAFLTVIRVKNNLNLLECVYICSPFFCEYLSSVILNCQQLL